MLVILEEYFHQKKKKLLWVGLYFVKKIQNSKPKPNDRKQKVQKQQTTSVAIMFNSRENNSNK